MSVNINPNYDPGTEATNQLYNTQIPSLTDDANIQEALRLYHYGSATLQPSNNTLIAANSMAGHLRSLKTNIDALDERGIGSVYSDTLPTAPTDGYVWVDSTSNAPTVLSSSLPIVALYQSSEPVDATTGMLWVDTDDDTLYVYNGSSWDSIASGGPGFTPPTTSKLDLFGTSQDVTASANQGFYYLAGGTTPTPFSVNTLVTTYSKTEISVNIGIQSSAGAVGPIALVRVVNGNVASPTTIGAFNHTNGSPLAFNFVDDHGQAPGSVLTYGLLNGTAAGNPGDITFSSLYSLQIYSREVA